jgi:predicted ATP-dependent Lon-type protease
MRSSRRGGKGCGASRSRIATKQSAAQSLLLLPVAARRQLNELPDEYWTKLTIEFYKDSVDAVFKTLVD